ncbi:hypothetical protein ACJZ2D_006480 [Fusarium nematophilum]
MSDNGLQTPEVQGYIYADLEPDAIRLLTLLPGEEEQDIRITLTHLPLIVPNPQPREIMTNNDDERNHEVGRMVSIFKLAHRVVVWLGPQSDNSDLALATLSSAAAQDDVGADALRQDDVNAARDLLRRLWFERLWVFQERLDLLHLCCLDDHTIDAPSWVPDFSVPTYHYGISGAQFASSMAKCEAEYLGHGVLEVMGVQLSDVLTVSESVRHEINNLVQAVQKMELHGLGTTDEPYVNGQNLMDTFIVTLRANHLQMGLAPAGTQPGDSVVALLGCDSHMVLRPTGDGQFWVVGEGYLHGFGDAEAFLGRLPGPWEAFVGRDSRAINRPEFKNTATGEVTIEDPRLGPLPVDWVAVPSERTHDDPYTFRRFKNREPGEEVNYYPRMLPDALRARDVKLRAFQLV